MLTTNLPQKAGQELSPMGTQALQLSGLLRNSPPWRRSMTDSEEVGGGVAVEGSAAAAWACLQPPLRIQKSAQPSSISSILTQSSFFGVARKATISEITPRRMPKVWPKIRPTCSSTFLQHTENGYRLPGQMSVEGG